MKFRRWHWEMSRPIHFVGDMQNALHWGQTSAQMGYLGVYSNVVHFTPSGKYGLDYPPLRLLVFTFWARWLNRYHPNTFTWRPDYILNRPVLLLNVVMEVASAVLVFFLVRDCRNRAGLAHGALLGVLAAMFLWFNPQLLISSWGRPAWEVWLVPFYLYAVLLASKDQWLASGAVLAVGSMFKGQEMLVAPVFILWPILSGNLLGAVRWMAGCCLGAAIVVFPWMLSRPMETGTLLARAADHGAILWFTGIVIAIALVLLWRKFKPSPRPLWENIASGAAFLLFVWPLFTRSGFAFFPEIFLIGAVSVALLRWAPWRYQSAVVSMIVGGSLFSCIALFHGDLEWFRIGFKYGAEKFPGLETGQSGSLAGLLDDRFGWSNAAPFLRISTPLGPKTPIVLNITQAMWALYVVSLVACSWGIAYLHRRRDPRWLVAIATPWLLYFALSPQMHERYLLWGAAVASVVVGVGLGMTLVALVISALSWMMTIRVLLDAGNPEELAPQWGAHFGTSLHTFVQGAHPGSGWLTLLCAAIFLYQTLRPARPSGQSFST